ncbi:MAG: hypothetical protein QOJ40_1312 [Verrucomicrobiota bacterium]|jgi:hypothetical protein
MSQAGCPQMASAARGPMLQEVFNLDEGAGHSQRPRNSLAKELSGHGRPDRDFLAWSEATLGC